MLEGSCRIKADALTYDLEDSVAVNQKSAARELVVAHLSSLPQGTQERIVRINSRFSGFAEADLEAIRGLNIDTIMLPKTETAEDVVWLANKLEPKIKIIALIESGLAIMNIKDIATASPRLNGLVFAAEDFAASMNISRSKSLLEMTFARQTVVTAAKAYGLDAIDLVCTEYKDADILRSEASTGAAFGFSGKQAIHPQQVSIIQEAFSPDSEKVAWAQGVLNKADQCGLGAFEYEGRMVDAPVLVLARNILKKHREGLEPTRGLLLGAPGAGKGTQCKKIIKQFPDISVLSSGDLLRDHMNRATDLGLKAKEIIARGDLVDDDTMCDLVISTLRERDLLSQSFFLDGFPRTESQAHTLDQYLEKQGIPLNLVANLQVPYSVILDRIINRWIHAPSGRTYNLTFNPPRVEGKDDITGEPLSKRLDDDVETFRARLKIYDETTIPLLSHYKALGVLYTFSGETSDIIWPQIAEVLDLRR